MSSPSAPAARVLRVLSPARAATRARLIAACIDLATDGGYDAVTIRAVAAQAGTSVPTVYQHVSTKDDLLVEALMQLSQESTTALAEHPPTESTPAQRIATVFTRIMRAAADKPLLYQALYRAWVASAPAILGLDPLALGRSRAPWIGQVLRTGATSGASEADLVAAEEILSCLFLGAMIGVAAGRDVDEGVAVMTEAAHRLLP